MENKTYEIEIDGRIIPVTTKEVLDFYPKEYHLTEDDIRTIPPSLHLPELNVTGSMTARSMPLTFAGFWTKNA